jgi:hemerythrin-like metal-binding protein
MPIMTWNDSLSVGVDAMDLQHKKLVDLTNKLFDSMKQGKGKQVLQSVLTDLVSYTRVHFAAEEKFMQGHNYPALSEHKIQHQRLIEKVSGFCKKFNEGQMGIPIDLCEFLENWLKVHISSEDKLYGQHANAKAVAAG